MVRIQRLTGAMTPKSVVASPTGHVFAQNMMYSHSVTALTPDGAIEKTISDAVKLSDFGVKGHPGTSKGAPVEMAFSPDGKTAWVSNYAMYGEGFSPEGADACTGPEGISDSYLYKIDTDSLEIKDVVRVGAVPKYVAATHDGSKVLVTNWCSMDLDVVDTAKGEVVTTIPIDGKHPRGIAITPDDKVAFVAVMGSDKTVRVDLESGKTSDFAATGDGPRHLLVSPDGSKLYISNNGAGTVSEVDATTGKTLPRGAGRVRAALDGDQPRRRRDLRRQLRQQHGEQDPDRGLRGRADREDRRAAHRHHLRAHEEARVGRQLRRLDHRLRRLADGVRTAP